MSTISGKTTLYGKVINQWPDECILEIERISGYRTLVGLTKSLNEQMCRILEFEVDALLRIHGTAKWDSETLQVLYFSANELEVVSVRPMGEMLDYLREHAGIESAEDAIKMIDGEQPSPSVPRSAACSSHAGDS